MLNCVFFISIHTYQVHRFTHATLSLDSHVVAVQLAQYLYLQLRWYYKSFFLLHAIYYGHLMSDGPIFFMSCATSFFVCGQPCIIHALSSCRFAFLAVASCISYMDVHTGRSNVLLIVLKFMLKPSISLSLFTLWLCHDNQSAVSTSGPDLYRMHT